jgi:hypothetical protein
MGKRYNCFNLAVCHRNVDTTQQSGTFYWDKVAATARKKLKLILKIKWLHEKYKEKITEYGEELTMEELEKLSLTNLLMM